jgi:hypothetical protein
MKSERSAWSPEKGLAIFDGGWVSRENQEVANTGRPPLSGTFLSLKANHGAESTELGPPACKPNGDTPSTRSLRCWQSVRRIAEAPLTLTPFEIF